jgi:lysophospholipase L1-like esterase
MAQVEQKSNFTQRVIVNVMIVIVATILCLLLLEILLRIVNPSIVNSFSRQPLIYQPHESLGYTYIPSSEGLLFRESDYHVNVQINSHGFHDEEFTLQKPEDITRIAIVGDSYSAGLHVSSEQTYANVLERQLNESDACKCEVYNFGVDGYGTDNELIMLRDVALNYQPDIVILQIFKNDISNAKIPITFRDNYRGYVIYYDDGVNRANIVKSIDKYLSEPLNQFLVSTTPDIYVVRAFYNLFLRNEENRSNHITLNGYRGFSLKNIQQYSESEAQARLIDNIENMQSLCNENDCQFLVMVLPSKPEAKREELSYYAKPIMKSLDESDIVYVDMFPPLTDQIEQGNAMYWLYDGHINVEGYTVIGSELAEYMMESGLLTN